jgi:hypothetical protein
MLGNEVWLFPPRRKFKPSTLELLNNISLNSARAEPLCKDAAFPSETVAAPNSLQRKPLRLMMVDHRLPSLRMSERVHQ